MAKVVVVDNDDKKRDAMVKALNDAGHDAVPAPGDRKHKIQGNLVQLLTAHSDPWDILLLDVNFPANAYGGIELYNRLVENGLNRRWRHTIIRTVYAGGPEQLKSRTDQDALVLRVFVETAGIPYESVLSSVVGGFQPVLDRINQLLGEPDRRCPHCGRPMP